MRPRSKWTSRRTLPRSTSRIHPPPSSPGPSPLLASSLPQPHAVISDTSNDTSPTSTLHGGSTPTGTAVVPGSDHSGTVIARTTTTADSLHTRRRSTLRPPTAPAPNPGVRTDTEPESDADAEMHLQRRPGGQFRRLSPPQPVRPPPPLRLLQAQPPLSSVAPEDDSAALDVGMNLNVLLVGVDDGFVTWGKCKMSGMTWRWAPLAGHQATWTWASVLVSDEVMAVPEYPGKRGERWKI